MFGICFETNRRKKWERKEQRMEKKWLKEKEKQVKLRRKEKIKKKIKMVEGNKSEWKSKEKLM